MRVSVTMKNDKWKVVPTAGPFCGKHIADADAIRLQKVKIVNQTMTGEIEAVWGLDVKCPELFDHPREVKGLRLGRNFDMRPMYRASVRDGRMFWPQGEPLTEAFAVWADGKQIHALPYLTSK